MLDSCALRAWDHCASTFVIKISQVSLSLYCIVVKSHIRILSIVLIVNKGILQSNLILKAVTLWHNPEGITYLVVIYYWYCIINQYLKLKLPHLTTVNLNPFTNCVPYCKDMGAYLSRPKAEKTTEVIETSKLRCYASCMQGWRLSMEVISWFDLLSILNNCHVYLQNSSSTKFILTVLFYWLYMYSVQLYTIVVVRTPYCTMYTVLYSIHCTSVSQKGHTNPTRTKTLSCTVQYCTRPISFLLT